MENIPIDPLAMTELEVLIEFNLIMAKSWDFSQQKLAEARMVGQAAEHLRYLKFLRS